MSDQLERLGAEWPFILASRGKSVAMMERLRRELDIQLRFR